MAVKYEILVILLHYWKKDMSASEAVRHITEVEGPDAINKRTAIRWFAKFKSGDISLKRHPGSGRVSMFDEDLLKESIESNPSKSTRLLAAEVGSSKSTIQRHLHSIEKKYKAPRIDPYELSESQANTRLEICKSLLNNPLDDRFFKMIVAMDEKWVLFNNPNRKYLWLSENEPPASCPKVQRFGKKVMLSVFWNFDGILFFELLSGDKRLNSDIYSAQLKRLHEVMTTKYPSLINRNKVLLQADNAKPHISRKSMETINSLNGIELLPHPPYSPDIAASDFHLFRSMSHFLRGRCFKNEEALYEELTTFFDSKPSEWYKSGIRKIAQRWALVCENNGFYFCS